MKRAAEEMDADWWADDILELCSEGSFYFTAFRAHVLIEGYGRVKSTSVPLIHRLWFLPDIIGYITAKYLIGLVTRSEPQLSGHVFCCHSTAPYKTEAFFELVDQFYDSGEDTTLPSVKTAALTATLSSLSDLSFGRSARGSPNTHPPVDASRRSS